MTRTYQCIMSQLSLLFFSAAWNVRCPSALWLHFFCFLSIMRDDVLVVEVEDQIYCQTHWPRVAHKHQQKGWTRLKQYTPKLEWKRPKAESCLYQRTLNNEVKQPVIWDVEIIVRVWSRWFLRYPLDQLLTSRSAVGSRMAWWVC